MANEHILLVEDDGILAIHLQDLLERQGYTVMKPIATGEEAIVIAKQQQPALILMDIELAGKMSGVTAAEKITAEMDIPVIFLTGYSHDPLLQQAKFTTPYGYLIKPVPERELAATIEMALYKHQLDHQVKASEAKYRTLIEQASDGIFLSDTKGRYLEVNTAGCELLGYSRQEILQLNISDLIPPEDMATKPLRMPEISDGASIRKERRMKRKDGSLVDVEISEKFLENGSLQSIIRDITERRENEHQLQQNEHRLQLLLEIAHYEANDSQDLLDYALTKAIELTKSKIGYIYYYDEKTEEFTLNSWSKEVLPACSVLNPQTNYQLINTGIWGEAVRQRKPIIDNDFQVPNPLKKGYPEGHVHLHRFLTVPVFIEKAIVAVVGVANKDTDYDQTDVLQLSLLMDSIWKIVERKQVQDRIEENEQKYRKLFENLSTGFALHEIILDEAEKPVDYRFIEMNPAFEHLTGMSAAASLGKSVKEILPETEPFWIETYGKVALTGESIQFVHFSKQIAKHFEVMAYSPKKGYFATIIVDVTQRMQEEEIIRTSQEALKRAQAVSHVGSWEWDIREDKLRWSDEMYHIFGIDKASFTGKLDDVIPLRIHPEDIQRVDQSNSSVKDYMKPIPLEYRVILPDNTIRDVWAEAGDLVLDEDGNAAKLTGIVQDITDRKKADEERDRLEIKFTKTFQATPDAISITRLEDGKFIDINEAYARISGYSLEEVTGRTTIELNLWPDLEQRKEVVQQIQENGEVSNRELTFQAKDGRLIPTLFSATTIDISGENCLISIIRDMTEYKKAQDSINLQSTALNAAANAIVITDRDGKIQWANKAFTSLTGYDENEAFGKNPRELVKSGVHDEVFYKNMWDTILAGKVWHDEIINRRKDGSTYIEEMTITPVLDLKNEVVQFIAIKQDITERNNQAEVLRLSEERFSQAFLISPDSININRLSDGMYLEINEGFTRLTGFTREDVDGKTSLELDIWVDPADRKRLVKGLQEKGEVLNLQASFRTKPGEIKECLMSARTINVNDEKCILSITRDLTERIQAERAVMESEEKFRNIFEKSALGISIADLDGKFINANPAILKMLGYSLEEYCQLTIGDISHPDDTDLDLSLLQEELVGKRPSFSIEKRNLHKDGHIVWGHLTNTLVFDTAGKPAYTIGMFEDITERKKNEEARREQEHLLQTVFEAVPAGIFVVNREGKIAYLNPAGQKIWGGARYVGVEGLEEYKGWNRETGKRISAHEWGSARAFEKGERVLDEEVEIECFNGERKIITNSAIPLYDEHNAIMGAVVVNHDITEEIIAKDELKRRNEYLFAMQETTYELISQLDLDQLLEKLTIRAGLMLDTESCFLDIIDPASQKLIPKVGTGALQNFLKLTPRPGKGVAGMVWQTGKPYMVNDYEHWVGGIKGLKGNDLNSVVGVPLISGEELLGVVGLGYTYSSGKVFGQQEMDILTQFSRLATIAIKNARLFTLAQQELEDRKVAEAALRESEQRFHQMFAEHNATMLLLDVASGSIIDANPAASSFYGYSLDKLRSMHISDINLLKKAKIKETFLSIVEKKGDVLIFPHRLASGEVRTVEVHSSPIEVDHKKILFSIVHDVTERVQAETQIQQQLDELRRWNSVTVGRESRIMELKHEVNELLKKLGTPPRYEFTREPEND